MLDARQMREVEYAAASGLLDPEKAGKGSPDVEAALTAWAADHNAKVAQQGKVP